MNRKETLENIILDLTGKPELGEEEVQQLQNAEEELRLNANSRRD